MILDTSAIIAIIFQENGFNILLQKIVDAQVVGVSAATLVEAGIVISAKLNQPSTGILARFVQEVNAQIIPFSGDHYAVALDAFMKFGKGRHRAALNFGDCLTYATAKLANHPLLFVGEDFSKTDLAIA